MHHHCKKHSHCSCCPSLFYLKRKVGFWVITCFVQSPIHSSGRARVLGSVISMGNIVPVERGWYLGRPFGAYKGPASGAFIGGSTNLPDWIGYIVDICQVIVIQPIIIKIATIVIDLKSLWGHKGGLS